MYLVKLSCSGLLEKNRVERHEIPRVCLSYSTFRLRGHPFSITMVDALQEVILASIRDEGGAFEYASEDLKNDYDFALEVVAMGGPGDVGEGGSMGKPGKAKVSPPSNANYHQRWCWIGIGVLPGGFKICLTRPSPLGNNTRNGLAQPSTSRCLHLSWLKGKQKISNCSP